MQHIPTKLDLPKLFGESLKTIDNILITGYSTWFLFRANISSLECVIHFWARTVAKSWSYPLSASPLFFTLFLKSLPNPLVPSARVWEAKRDERTLLCNSTFAAFVVVALVDLARCWAASPLIKNKYIAFLPDDLSNLILSFSSYNRVYTVGQSGKCIKGCKDTSDGVPCEVKQLQHQDIVDFAGTAVPL